MKITADTNVLLRLVLADDEAPEEFLPSRNEGQSA